MLLLQLEICKGSPILVNKRQSLHRPLQGMLHSYSISSLTSSSAIPLLFPLLSLSQPRGPSCYCWMGQTCVQDLCTYSSFCLLSLSPKCEHDLLCHLLQIFPQMSSSQWGLLCLPNFKLQVISNLSMLYLLASTYNHLMFIHFTYLCMYFCNPLIPHM